MDASYRATPAMGRWCFLVVLTWVSACHDRPTESAGASWPALAAHYTLQTIDGAALPTETGPDSARLLIDSARFDFDPLSATNAWTLTPFVSGGPAFYVHSLSSLRVAADSFVVNADIPGAPPPELFLAVRDSTLVLYWRPPASGVSLAARIVGQRNQDWRFRAR